LVAVAAHSTWPAVRLVQLGVELTAPANVIHVPQALPLWTPTANVAFGVKAAHATTPADTAAQDGTPTVATVVAAVRALHDPHAPGVETRETHKHNRNKNLRLITILSS
jgi:hypothetical protein